MVSEATMNPQTVMSLLQAPFHPDDIEWRVGSTNSDKTRGLALAYVTNRAIQNRLDDIFGPFGWKNEYREWKNTSQICGISVKFNDEWITKWDGADDSQTEATKGGLSDAMKRAGYQWGIGRYLYKLDGAWVPIEQRGKSYVLKETPALPAWALPADYRAQGKTAPPSVDKPRIQKTPELPTDQVVYVHDLIKQKGITELQHAAILKKRGIVETKYMTQKQYEMYVAYLEELPDKEVQTSA